MAVENPYESPQYSRSNTGEHIRDWLPDSESRSMRNSRFAVRAALCFHVAVTVNFVIYGVLVYAWVHFGWATNPVFAVYVECSNFLANRSFLFMPVVLLLLVIFLPLSFPAGKRAAIVLASLGLNIVLLIMVMLLMTTPDYGL